MRRRPIGSSGRVVEHRRDPASYVVEVGGGQPEAGRAPLEPREVTGQRERHPVQGLDRLEDPVPDGEPVVGDRDRPLGRVGQEVTVDPRAHGRHSRGRHEPRGTGVAHGRGGRFWRRRGHVLLFHSHSGPVKRRRMQADIAQLVERNLAKVEVASSSLVVRSEGLPRSFRNLHGGLAERRGNGLQIRLHGFKSRTHLRQRSTPTQLKTWAIGAAVARFLDTEEVTGSNPVSPTSNPQVGDSFSACGFLCAHYVPARAVFRTVTRCQSFGRRTLSQCCVEQVLGTLSNRCEVP